MSIPIWFPFEPDVELAESLTAEFNEFVMLLEGYELIDDAAVLPILRNAFLPEELKFIIESEYGRGFIMGCISTLIALHEAEKSDAENEL